MKIKIFSDGANINEMLDINKNPIISGFTTNPTLMYKAGIPNYKVFSQHVSKKLKINQSLLKYLLMTSMKWNVRQEK